MSLFHYLRSIAVMAVLSLTLAACGQQTSQADKTDRTAKAGDQKLQLMDIVQGDPSAPLTLIEYGSWTCAACLDFHTRILPQFKTDYIETGKVKLVFREFPTAPQNVSVAGFIVARCAGPDNYYALLEDLFSRQSAFMTLARNGKQVSEALQQVAQNYGIMGEDAFIDCLQSEDIRNAIKASIAAGDAQNVSATPTLILNGKTLPNETRLSYETFRQAVEAALAEQEN